MGQGTKTLTSQSMLRNQLDLSDSSAGGRSRPQRPLPPVQTHPLSEATHLSVRQRPCAPIAHSLPLAFLAPSIVGTILEGRQPADLSLKQLMYRTDLAVSWTTQRQQLGIET